MLVVDQRTSGVLAIAAHQPLEEERHGGQISDEVVIDLPLAAVVVRVYVPETVQQHEGRRAIDPQFDLDVRACRPTRSKA